ncbi:hypothetical protein A2U01_0045383, partial [Trifolium medium]|nr:hypothetical protein [Trifolium medium]
MKSGKRKDKAEGEGGTNDAGAKPTWTLWHESKLEEALN